MGLTGCISILSYVYYVCNNNKNGYQFEREWGMTWEELESVRMCVREERVIYAFYVCGCFISMHICISEEDTGSHGTTVTDNYTLPCVLGTELRASGRSASALNCQAISPAPVSGFYYYSLRESSRTADHLSQNNHQGSPKAFYYWRLVIWIFLLASPL